MTSLCLAPSGRAGQGWFLPALCSLLLWLGAAHAVHAHAQLLETSPADGAVLEAAPERISLRFGEAARAIIARLTLPDGETVVLPDPEDRIDGDTSTISWPLPDLTARGSYLLSWRVTSADGHPLAGAYLFSIGAPSDLQAAVDPVPFATRAGLWAARSLLIGALIFGVGGVAFSLLSGRSPPHGLRGIAGAGLIALPLVLGFQGLELLALGPGSLFSIGPWREGLSGPPGLALGAAGLALLLALFAGPRGRGMALAILSLIALGLSFALSGHAATAAPQVLMRPAVLLHVLAAAFWIGALLPLAAILIPRGDTDALLRFSALVPGVLALLIATGLMLAVVQLDHLPALWQTGYGRILLVKLGLLAALLALALWNRLRLTPRALAGNPRPLIRSIGAEVVLGALIIATLALWRFTPPPRSLPPPATPIVQILQGDHLSARITLTNDRPGPVRVTLDDLRLDGVAFTPMETTVEFAKPAYGLGPFARTIPGQSDDRLDAGGFVLPIDGFWVLTLTVLVDDFRSEKLRDIITIRK